MFFCQAAKFTLPRVTARRWYLSTNGAMAMQTNGNGQAASSSNMRLQGLCLPETDGIRLREHSTSSRNSHQSAKRMFKREHLGAIFTGIAVLVFGRYYFKTSIEDKRQATGHRAGDNIDTDTYIDPHRKCKGKLIRFKADEPFWLPEEFLNQYKLNQVTQFPVDDTDIFVVSFPKSGIYIRCYYFKKITICDVLNLLMLVHPPATPFD